MSLSFSNQKKMRNSIIDSQSKIALLQYVNERKEDPKNYQKKSLFWDREHLYSENMMLRARIKELTQTNTKNKTKLLASEKQIYNLTVKSKINEDTPSIFRSISTKRISSIEKQNTLNWKSSKLQDQEQNKMTLMMKQLIRELKDNNQKLHNQNSQLKKSIKYTRMNELQTENKELSEENLRLHKSALQAKMLQQESCFIFAKQIEELKNSLRKEIQAKNNAIKQFSKLKKQSEQIELKYRQLQKNKIINQRKFTLQIDTFKRQNKQQVYNIHKNKLPGIVNQHADSPTKFNYSLSITEKEKDQNPSINFDKLISQQSHSKLKIPQSDKNMVSIETQSPKLKKQGNSQGSQITSLEHLMLKGDEQPKSASRKEPPTNTIDQQNYEDEFQVEETNQKAEQIDSNKSLKHEQLLEDMPLPLNTIKKLGKQKMSIEEQLKQNLLNQQDSEYEYIMEDEEI